VGGGKSELLLPEKGVKIIAANSRLLYPFMGEGRGANRNAEAERLRRRAYIYMCLANPIEKLE